VTFGGNPDLKPEKANQTTIGAVWEPIAGTSVSADWFYLDVKGPDGKTENWGFEAGTPSVLFRRGFTKASLMPGTKVKVDGYQAKDGTRRANGRDLTFADGKKLFMGSSGTGAPYELARPGVDTERK